MREREAAALRSKWDHTESQRTQANKQFKFWTEFLLFFVLLFSNLVLSLKESKRRSGCITANTECTQPFWKFGVRVVTAFLYHSFWMMTTGLGGEASLLLKSFLVVIQKQKSEYIRKGDKTERTTETVRKLIEGQCISLEISTCAAELSNEKISGGKCTQAHIAGSSAGHSPQRHKQRKRGGQNHDCGLELRGMVVPRKNRAPGALNFTCRMHCSHMRRKKRGWKHSLHRLKPSLNLHSGLNATL